eukprot:CAMPEP_0116842844 /NCGR_PEP_ID=MMETSP0418-20121206/11745_1 /TAXON_ID=1158023 /ORGANISM="Astrosyne radiata, Strain 13vi08-1A" /LENGTH=178 /DNA_ID=CAMNT_0004473505 /DNA_START=48 /DNA_END=584 /DNA_ORIENTATION=+
MIQAFLISLYVTAFFLIALSAALYCYRKLAFDNEGRNIHHQGRSSGQQTGNDPEQALPVQLQQAQHQQQEEIDYQEHIRRAKLESLIQFVPYQDPEGHEEDDLDIAIAMSNGQNTTTPKKEDNNKGICTICMEPFDEGVLVNEIVVCPHQFHKDCLMDWFQQRHDSCPTCRVPMVDEV